MFQEEFINRMVALPGDKSFSIVQFSDDANTMTDLADGNAAIDVLYDFVYVGGFTNTSDALMHCTSTFDGSSNIRYTLLITDGVPTVPKPDPQGAATAASQEATAAGINIVPVYIDTQVSDETAIDYLRSLGNTGTFLRVGSFDELDDILDELISSISYCGDDITD